MRAFIATRTHRFRFSLVACLAAVALLGLPALLPTAFATPAAAQTCDSIAYRVVDDNRDREVWYRHGETVQVVSGHDAALFVHVDLPRVERPYATEADIGYPQEFDFRSVDSREVLNHVRMRAQTAEDVSLGRIRFRGEEPGTTLLGYVIESVEARVRLDNLDDRCLRDQLRIEVVSSAAQLDDADRAVVEDALLASDDRPTDRGVPTSTRESAAKTLVGTLSESLLQRDLGAGALEDGELYVDTVLGEGTRGLARVAEEILTSREFRTAALERIESRFGNASDERLRWRLLEEIYRDLYGFDEPSTRAQRRDFELLEGCMGFGRSADNACQDLAGRLIDRRAFEDRHEDELESLDDAWAWRSR